MTEYGSKDYWEDRYQKERDNYFDWLQGYQNLKPLLEKFLNRDMRLLNIGCGNALFSVDQYDDGYHKNVNIDISQNVIDFMNQKTENRPGLEFQVMDARKLEYESSSFDVAIDKGTMDALLCGDTCYSDVASMVNEVQRVLKVGGYYIVVSYGKPENRLLHFLTENLSFKVDHMIIEKENQDMTKVYHFMYVAQKKEDADEKSRKFWPKLIKDIKDQEKREIDALYEKPKQQEVSQAAKKLMDEFKIKLDSESDDEEEQDPEFKSQVQKIVSDMQSNLQLNEQEFLSPDYFKQNLQKIDQLMNE